jgi:hypothetical protein
MNDLMTLGNFLKRFSLNRENKIMILDHQDNILYYTEGKEMTHSKMAYLDPNTRKMTLLGTSDLEKMVTNWTCYSDYLKIYIKGVETK